MLFFTSDITKRWIAVSTMMAASVVINGCATQQEQPREMPPAAVSVSEAISQDVPVYLDQIGKITAREVVAIQPQVSGQLLKRHFEDGADIKKGQLLFTLDPRPFETSLQQSQSNFARDNALKKQAESNLARDLATAKYNASQAARYSRLNREG